MKRVNVHIDRLVLTGIPRDDRHAFAAGLQEELGRVFSDRSDVSRLASMQERGRLHVDGVNFERGSKPQDVGTSVAHGIGREIMK